MHRLFGLCPKIFSGWYAGEDKPLKVVFCFSTCSTSETRILLSLLSCKKIANRNYYLPPKPTSGVWQTYSASILAGEIPANTNCANMPSRYLRPSKRKALISTPTSTAMLSITPAMSTAATRVTRQHNKS